MAVIKACFLALLFLVASATFLIPLYFAGYIGREIVSAASPDGQLEAVCRGWYPDQMDYELWVRPAGEWFGQRFGKVGGESSAAAAQWRGVGTES